MSVARAQIDAKNAMYDPIASYPMNKKILTASLMVLVFFSATICALPAWAKPSGIKESVENVLDRQCNAWNRGKLAEFMSGYLKSNDTSYTSSATQVWGYEALRKRYEKKYGNSRESMGKLKFSRSCTTIHQPEGSLKPG